MNISSVIETVMSALDNVLSAVVSIPALLLLCTCYRRPGFSSTLVSAKVYADTVQNENDDILKAFIYNVINRLKLNIQDDGVIFVAFKPGALQVQLNGGNAGGPIVLTGSNKNYVFAWAIIR